VREPVCSEPPTKHVEVMRATSVTPHWEDCKNHGCQSACEELLRRRAEAANFIGELTGCMPLFPDGDADPVFIDIEVAFDAYPAPPACAIPKF
jgi:hypothetical protein